MATRLPDPAQVARPSFSPTPLRGSYVGAAGVGEEAQARLGVQVADMASRESARLDTLQAEAALTKLRERDLELRVGPDGFSRVKGGAVLQGNLIDDYTQKYSDSVEEIASTLRTPQQQELFRARAAAAAVNYKGALYNHATAEADRYDAEVVEGTVAVEVRQATASWNDPAAIQSSRTRIEHTVTLAAERRGLPPEKAAQLRLAALSPLHAGVAAQAVSNKKFDYAEKYLRDNKDEMNISDLLRLGSEVQKQRGAALGFAAAQGVIQDIQQKTEPSDFVRLRNSMRTAESGNRDFGPDGVPITSATGAKYAGQVLPSTAKDPGFGIKPAQADSPEEFNRVSDEYLAVMLQRYDGDIAKALAAYNVGFGAVDAAVKKSGVVLDWFTTLTDPAAKILPEDQAAQVAAYVPKVLKIYAAGGGVPPRPTIVDVRRRVAEQLQGQPQDVVDAAQARAERDYNDLTAAQQQRENDALNQLIPLIDSGEVRTVDDIPPALATAMGQKKTTARKYIAAALKSEDAALTWSPVATDFYYALRNDTQRLRQASTAEIMALAPEIGISRTQALIVKKNKIEGDFDAEQAAQFDADQFTEVAQQFGFKTVTPAQKRALIPIRDRAEEALIGAQADAGKKLTRAEKREVLNRMFVKLRTTETYRPWYSFLPGVDPITRSVERRGYELRSPEQIAVPPEFRAQVVAAAKTAGIELTDAEIREEYVHQQIQSTLR